MKYLLATLVIRLWDLLRRIIQPSRGGLLLGYEVRNGNVSDNPVYVPTAKRPEHVVCIGRTGSGKTSLLRHFCAQDIRRNRGFAFIDLHGDTTPHLLALIAREERRLGRDLSSRVVVVDPTDADYSVGLNPLIATREPSRFVEIAEIVRGLRKRWGMDALGPRTEELLRSSLHVLADAGMTLLEVPPLLTNDAFRSAVISRVSPSQARSYFENRFNRLSEVMRAVYSEAVLNKLGELTEDHWFRHLLGQSQSTFSLSRVVEEGLWLIINLDKGRLGAQATTIGSLLLTKLRHSILGRRSRDLFTLYCDELQNLVAYDAGVETLLSEARKFATGVCTANQFLEQTSPQVRASILSVRTHILFQLSASDAHRIAHGAQGGANLIRTMQQLPKRHALVWQGGAGPTEIRVPNVPHLTAGSADLYERSRKQFARPRQAIEEEIAERQASGAGRELLHGWR